MNNSFWLILGVTFAGLVGIFLLMGGKDGSTNTGEFEYTEPLTSLQSHDHQEGEGTKATFIEYGDFQCPSCGALFPLLEQVKETFGDEVKIVFRHFPLSQIHPQALAAHRAAEAAARQGMFWEMHDELFIGQQTWSGSSNAAEVFENYAESLGLNMDQYREDVASASVFSKVNSDIESGQSLGVQSTPTLLFNGEILTNIPRTLDEFSQLINGSDESPNEDGVEESSEDNSSEN